MKDSFDVEFKGLEWNSGNHFALDGAIMRLYSDPRGRGVMFADELGLSYDANTSAGATVTMIDGAGQVLQAQLSTGAFKLKRIGIIDKLALGYRFAAPAADIEPYLGIMGQFDFVILGAEAVSDNNMLLPVLRFGFPMGIKVYRGKWLAGFEYTIFFKNIQMDNNLDYDSATQKSITGGFSDDGLSCWAVHLGIFF
jgi:hypothetical protein